MTIPRLVLPLGLVAAMVPIVASAQSAPPAARRDAPKVVAPAPDASRRVVVTAPLAPAYSCAAVTCRVVTELDKGAVVSVVKTDGEWHQVLVRTSANAMTTGWVKTAQVTATSDNTVRTGDDRTDGVFRPAPDASIASTTGASATAAAAPTAAEPDPRGCLTCLATREPTPDEWHAALADTATKKAAPADPRVAPGIADGRTGDERMRDVFAQRYDAELKRLETDAADVDGDLHGYLASCFQRFASIPVEGAPPRSTNVDEILKAARSSPGAARFALWSGTAAFQWNTSWAPVAEPSSSQPSCERLWEDVRGRADRVKVDVELLERDARDHDIYPGIVREQLAARGLAEPTTTSPPQLPARAVR